MMWPRGCSVLAAALSITFGVKYAQLMGKKIEKIGKGGCELAGGASPVPEVPSLGQKLMMTMMVAQLGLCSFQDPVCPGQAHPGAGSGVLVGKAELRWGDLSPWSCRMGPCSVGAALAPQERGERDVAAALHRLFCPPSTPSPF